MEEYASFVQETYFDENYAVDQSYWGEYEVYKVSRRRLLRLRKLNDAEGQAQPQTPFYYHISNYFAIYFHFVREDSHTDYNHEQAMPQMSQIRPS